MAREERAFEGVAAASGEGERGKLAQPESASDGGVVAGIAGAETEPGPIIASSSPSSEEEEVEALVDPPRPVTMARFRRADPAVSTATLKHHLQRNSRVILVALLLGGGVLLLWGLSGGSSNAGRRQPLFTIRANDVPKPEPPLPEAPAPLPKQVEQTNKERVLVEVYMECLCPDTTNFLMNQLWPTFTLPGFKEIMDLRLFPFGKGKCTPHGSGDFRCRCQHGPAECLGNQLMNCVMKAKPRVEDHLPVIRCLQGKRGEEEQRACLRDAHLEVDDLMDCRNSAEGRSLMATAAEATDALDPGLHFVPWVLVQGHRSENGWETYHFKDAVCKAYKGPDRPEDC